MERESMEFDVVIVGAGPAGLSTACKLMQLANENDQELMVCVVEKGSEVGAHILSGAVFEPRAMNELFPDWKEKGAPLNTPVTEDHIYLLNDENSAKKLPNGITPKTMHNEGNYIVSMGNVCRWLAEQAEQLGVEVFPGFSAAETIYNEDGSVGGVITGDMGVGENGEHKDGYMPGMELRAKYTIFAEGCRGHLGKELISHFNLDKDSSPQHYAIGFKEIWDIDPAKHQPGLVVHSAGWPLDEATGGSYMYHAEDNQVFVGLIVDLNYENPYLSPFDEFQRLKHHSVFKQYLEGGKRVSYGARAIAKGGFNSLPKMTFPGGLLVGCNAGTLNFAKIKGNHTAMKSGMLAAESIFEAIKENNEAPVKELTSFTEKFKSSWVYDELFRSRNFGPAIHKLGNFWGGAFNTLEQNFFKGNLPFTMKDEHKDYAQLNEADKSQEISYPKPDGVLSFDKLSSVFLSNTNHEEDQPCHLQLKDPSIPIQINLPKFAEPAQRYCPAGVYEIIEDEGEKRFQINAQNCVHCKTCDIKDPSQNIKWVVPEGTGGPNYPNM
ncbi:electron transfer flavoprotein-ubiquinone oxidoreductase [Alteromonas sp.]|uniref:electron transfer flavoprotein-ubiquinone oxidoreductase n=1 Tax=Alteromonas sp. TaxID=232 RepID=UPI000B6F35DF|nr:electron transfer flavoprotein-ubiquinone oxidoreductase [Alteromonas sp.]MAI39486.1 electron transfer flavoprotein-ubiquinone oxidoreductase [Alteromonas sp.]OUX83774.1 MAG: electron transfer flavoprotein-ubiquinone oxidoreductase [Alteromonas sp. TMED35]